MVLPFPPVQTPPYPPVPPKRKMVTLRLLVLLVAGALVGGGVVGFLLGVYSVKAGKDFLRSLVEDEQPAQVARPVGLDRAGFSLRYPSNWKIDTDDEDYDPDSMFSIDSPGSSYVMFVLHDSPSDPNTSLDSQIAAHRKRMTGMTESPLNRYGQLSARGVVLRGRLMGMPWTIRAFCLVRGGKSATIVEARPDEDSAQVQPGFELIENSFVLKPGPGRPASAEASDD